MTLLQILFPNRYVQFTEYSAFVRCMDEFRAMKLVRKDKDKLVAVNIEVNFDKTKHLSDVSIRRRKGRFYCAHFSNILKFKRLVINSF